MEELAGHDLIEPNLGFVVKVAHSYRGLGLPFQELLAEGRVGLVEAARRFDPERGARFTTFAVYWIRRSILRALAGQTSLVRLPCYQRRRLRAVLGATRALRAEMGRPPTRQEVAIRSGLPVRVVERVLLMKQGDVSLEEPVHASESLTLGDTLARGGDESPEHQLLRRESWTRVAWLMRDMSERERRVLMARYGLEGESSRTLRQVAGEMGLSREMVRLIEDKAIRRMRRLLTMRPLTALRPGLPQARAQARATDRPIRV